MVSKAQAAACLSVFIILVAGACEAIASVRFVVPEAPGMSATVSLRGNIAMERFYGPPNFGETPEQDRKEKATILNLEEEICVLLEDDSSCGVQDMQDSIQLVISTGAEGNVQAGECVVADGPLFRSFTGHHRRLILMTVMKLHPCHD